MIRDIESSGRHSARFHRIVGSGAVGDERGCSKLRFRCPDGILTGLCDAAKYKSPT
jgi:hypothetical protein